MKCLLLETKTICFEHMTNVSKSFSLKLRHPCYKQKLLVFQVKCNTIYHLYFWWCFIDSENNAVKSNAFVMINTLQHVLFKTLWFHLHFMGLFTCTVLGKDWRSSLPWNFNFSKSYSGSPIPPNHLQNLTNSASRNDVSVSQNLWHVYQECTYH